MKDKPDGNFGLSTSLKSSANIMPLEERIPGMTLSSGTTATALTPTNPWALVPALGNLDAYISAVNRLPLLTQEEEQKYARQLKEHNDVDAAGRLVLSHLRLVVSFPPVPRLRSAPWRP